MKLYEVEYHAVITVEADDLTTAELDATAFLKENPQIIRVRGAREINGARTVRRIFRPVRESMLPLAV